MEDHLILTFTKNQDLKAFAYECHKGVPEKLSPINFVHLTREEFANESRRYQSFPRLIHFNENDSIKCVSQKIFKDLRDTAKALLYM